MLKNIKYTIKNAVIYGMGNLASKVVGFILLPLYTQKLTVSEYVMLSVIEVSSLILISFFGMALYQALFRWYLDKQFIEKQKSIFFTSLIYILGIAVLMVVGLLFLSKPISLLLFQTTTYHYLIKLMIVSAGLELVLQIPNTLIRIQEKPKLFLVSNLIRLAFSFFFTLFFIIYLNKKIEGIYEALIIAQIVNLLILTKFIKKNITFKFDYKVLKEMIYYSLPLALSSIAAATIGYTDRLALNFVGAGLNDVGLYSLGQKMANTVNIFIVFSVNLAIWPLIFKKMNDPDNKRFYSKIMTYYAFGLMFFILLISLYGKEVTKVITLNPAYWDSYQIIPYISMAAFFGMLKDVSLIGLQITKKTKVIAIVIIGSAVLNVILNVILITFFQTKGSAIATLLTQIFYFILIYRFAQKQYYIPYEITKVIKILVISFAMMVVSEIINPYSLWIRLFTKTTLLCSFPILLYLWNFYEKAEIEALKNFWLKWKNPQNWKNNMKQIKF